MRRQPPGSVETTGLSPSARLGGREYFAERLLIFTRGGPPTEVRGNDWIYTPGETGCHEVSISKVMTFKHGVVAAIHEKRRQTGKVCGRRWQ